MPLPVLPDTYQCRLLWANGAIVKLASNDLYVYDLTPPHTEAEVYSALDAAVLANQWALVSSGSSVEEVVVTKLDGASAGVTFETGSPDKWTGQGDTQFQPQCCQVVTLRTGLAGRSHRGRVYLPWINNDASAAGVLNATDVALAQAAWTTFVGALNTASFPLVVVSKKLTASFDVTAVKARANATTQRRRALKSI